MTLLSFASRQIWPQVLGFLQLSPKPDRMVLFHTAEPSESKGPAERLRELFVGQDLLPDEAVLLVEVPHDDFSGVLERIADTADGLHLGEENCRLNLTGGNKLMALAAAEWCRRAQVSFFYLERDFRVFPFLPRGDELLPQESFQIDSHLARQLDPLALLRCQQGDAEVAGPGQRLTLNDRGLKLPLAEIMPCLKRDEDFRKFLHWDVADTIERAGDGLEFATALTVLKHGIPMVQRGVRRVPKAPQASGREEGELDLVFNWAGKLWVADCKDRHGSENRVQDIRTEIIKTGHPTPRISELLDRLGEELRRRELHPLKVDLLDIAEVGGDLGRVIGVRRSMLPVEARDFARSRRIEVAYKETLVDDLRRILFPGIHAGPSVAADTRRR